MTEIIHCEPIQRGEKVAVKLAKTLEWVYRYCETYPGAAPTIRDIQQSLGISSTSLASGYLNRLVQQGKLSRLGGKCRGYVPVGGQWIRPQIIHEPVDEG